MEKGSHDNASVGDTMYPFALRQPTDPLRHEPIVRPTDEFHHRRKICCRRNRIEQSDGRKLRGDQAMGRLRRGCKSVRHRKTISVSL